MTCGFAVNASGRSSNETYRDCSLVRSRLVVRHLSVNHVVCSPEPNNAAAERQEAQRRDTFPRLMRANERHSYILYATPLAGSLHSAAAMSCVHDLSALFSTAGQSEMIEGLRRQEIQLRSKLYAKSVFVMSQITPLVHGFKASFESTTSGRVKSVKRAAYDGVRNSYYWCMRHNGVAHVSAWRSVSQGSFSMICLFLLLEENPLSNVFLIVGRRWKTKCKRVK
jgi:hypothetical protein